MAHSHSSQIPSPTGTQVVIKYGAVPGKAQVPNHIVPNQIWTVARKMKIILLQTESLLTSQPTLSILTISSQQYLLFNSAASLVLLTVLLLSTFTMSLQVGVEQFSSHDLRALRKQSVGLLRCS